MFEKYSELSLRSLDLAQAVAREFSSDLIGDEHLLLGVVGVGAGTAAAPFKSFNVNYKNMHSQLKELTEAGSNVGGEISFDISGKRTLEKAWLVAREYGHKKLYTGHIVVGVIALGGGLVDILLQNLLINKMELREKIIESFDDEAAVAAEDATPKPSCVPPKVYDYLSAEGLVAMTFAEQEARKSGLSFLGAEHILIGLLMQETGAAAQVLKANNVTLELLRQKTSSIAEFGTGWTPRQLPLTRRAVKIMQAALLMAEEMGQDRIDTEQLLLAITRSDGGLATAILSELGVKIISP